MIKFIKILRLFYFEILFPQLMNIPSHKLRIFFLRRHLLHLGKNTSVMRGVTFLNINNISIGDNVVINNNVLLDGRGGILTILNNVDIAREVYIWTLEHDIQSTMHESIGGSVLIKNGAWIASRATILPGIIIGENSVVATGAVVTKNVLDNDVVGGIPAKKIGFRVQQNHKINTFFPIFR